MKARKIIQRDIDNSYDYMYSSGNEIIWKIPKKAQENMLFSHAPYNKWSNHSYFGLEQMKSLGWSLTTKENLKTIAPKLF